MKASSSQCRARSRIVVTATAGALVGILCAPRLAYAEFYTARWKAQALADWGFADNWDLPNESIPDNAQPNPEDRYRVEINGPAAKVEAKRAYTVNYVRIDGGGMLSLLPDPNPGQVTDLQVVLGGDGENQGGVFVGRDGAGSLSLSSNTEVNCKEFWVGANAASEGSVTLNDGSWLGVTQTAYVGREGMGAVTQHGGAQIGRLDVTTRRAPLKTPSYTVEEQPNGNAALNVLEDLRVGWQGNGRFTQKGGLVVARRDLVIGCTDDVNLVGRGDYVMQSGKLTVIRDLRIGEQASSGGFLQEGGEAFVSQDLLVRANGEFRITGGDLEVDRDLITAGRVLFDMPGTADIAKRIETQGSGLVIQTAGRVVAGDVVHAGCQFDVDGEMEVWGDLGVAAQRIFVIYGNGNVTVKGEVVGEVSNTDGGRFVAHGPRFALGSLLNAGLATLGNGVAQAWQEFAMTNYSDAEIVAGTQVKCTSAAVTNGLTFDLQSGANLLGSGTFANGSTGTLVAGGGSQRVELAFTDAGGTIDVRGSELHLAGGLTVKQRPIGDTDFSTKTGPGRLIVSGPQQHEPGAVFVAQQGQLVLRSDAGTPGLPVSSQPLELRVPGTAVTFEASQHLRGLVITSGGSAVMAEHGNRVLVAGIGSADGTLDLKDNGAVGILPASVGGPITSSLAGGGLAVGSMSNYSSADPTVPPVSDFFGEAVYLHSTLTRLTWVGDVNLDGQVNATDRTWFLAGDGWRDFDGDGVPDAEPAGLAVIDQNMGKGVVTHNYGTLTGMTRLLRGSVMTMGTAANKTLSSATLLNAGAVTWSGGNLFLAHGSVIRNSGTFDASAAASCGMAQGAGAAGGFENLDGGTFRKGGSAPYLSVLLPFTQQRGAGTLDVAAGVVEISGALSIASDATLTKAGAAAGGLRVLGPQAHGPRSTLAVTGGWAELYTDAGAGGAGGANLTLRAGGAAGAGVAFYAGQHLAGLDLSAGGEVIVAEGIGALVRTGRLSFGGTLTAPQGKVDLTDNDLIIDEASAADVRKLMRAGYNATTKTFVGQGLGTSIASVPPLPGQTAASTALGYAQGDDPQVALTLGGTFNGEAYDAAAVVVKFTYHADADLDGDVDMLDVMVWGPNFTGELGGGPTATKVWTQGDWDYDGDVDNLDVALWGPNFTGELGGGGLLAAIEGGEAAGGEASASWPLAWDGDVAPGWERVAGMRVDMPAGTSPEALAILRSLGLDARLAGDGPRPGALAAVPEPSALGLLASAGLGLLGRRGRRGRR